MVYKRDFEFRNSYVLFTYENVMLETDYTCKWTRNATLRL